MNCYRFMNVTSTRFYDTLRHELNLEHCKANSLYESTFPLYVQEFITPAISYKKYGSSEDSHVDLSSTMGPFEEVRKDWESET